MGNGKHIGKQKNTNNSILLSLEALKKLIKSEKFTNK